MQKHIITSQIYRQKFITISKSIFTGVKENLQWGTEPELERCGLRWHREQMRKKYVILDTYNVLRSLTEMRTLNPPIFSNGDS